jgi:hypothetical protein
VLAGLVLLSPLAPVAVVVFLPGAASLLASSAGVAAGTWAYRYFTGRHPVHAGAPRAEPYSRQAAVADVASRVRMYYNAYARSHGSRGVGRGGGWMDVGLLFVRVFIGSF